MPKLTIEEAIRRWKGRNPRLDRHYQPWQIRFMDSLVELCQP